VLVPHTGGLNGSITTEGYTAIQLLASQYNFEVFLEPELVRAIDKVSSEFHNGWVSGNYRKLAMWSGPLEEFIYLDVDTVILHQPCGFFL
jgi:hypothetical protein